MDVKSLLTESGPMGKSRNSDMIYGPMFISWRTAPHLQSSAFGSGTFPGLEQLANAGTIMAARPSRAPSDTPSSDSLDSLSNTSPLLLHGSDYDGEREHDMRKYTGDEGIGLKPKRKRATPKQLEVLREIYKRTPFPSSDTRKDLAKSLGMTARSVQIWFQNQRQLSRSAVNMGESKAGD